MKFILNKYNILIILYLVTPYVVNIKTVDIVGPQWLYLSLINILSFSFLVFKGELTKFKLHKEILYFFFFFIFSALSIFKAYNIEAALVTLNEYFIITMSLFGFYLLVKSPNTNISFEIILTILIFLDTTYSTILSVKDIINETFQYRSLNYAGFGANGNITSFAILYKIPFIFYFFLKTKNLSLKIVHLYIIISATFLIVIFGSRAAILSYFLILLITSIKSIFSNKIKSFTPILLVTLLTFFLTSSSLQSADSFDRISTLQTFENDTSISARLRYYSQAIQSFTENPFFGIGIGNWKIESIKLDKENLIDYIIPYHAHNDFLQILAESGIFAFIFYALFFTSFAFFLFKRVKVDFYFFAACSLIIYIIDSSFNFPIARPISFIFLIVLISYSLNINEKTP